VETRFKPALAFEIRRGRLQPAQRSAVV